MSVLNRFRGLMAVSLLGLLVMSGVSAAQAEVSALQDNFTFAAVTEAVPAIPSGAMVGLVGKDLVVAGGFTAEGKPSNTLQVLPGADVARGGWQAVTLATPRAGAASVAYKDSLLLIGGLTPDGVSKEVVKLSLVDGKAVEGKLADLPEPRMLAGAGVLGDNLYVLGGVASAQPAEATTTFYKLNLTAPNPAWEVVEGFEGVGRILPSIAVFYSELHVFGGLSLNAGTATPLNDAFGFREKPVDGTLMDGWKRYADIPAAIGGAASINTGQTHAVVAGGVASPVPFALPMAPPAASLSKRSFIFHNVTDTWLEDQPLPTGTLGGVFTKSGEGFTLVSSAGAASLTIDAAVRSLGVLDYIVMLIFFAAMAWIGYYFAAKQTNSDEFALGGRNVKWWAAGISMFATGASSISFMAIPAQVFRTNIIWFGPLILAFPFIYFLKGYILYPLIRRLNLTSTYEFLELRYSSPLRLVASFQSIAFQLLGRMSVVMLLPAMAITAVTGMDVYLSVALMGFLTTIYTTMGGFEAVVWTDVTQGILMFFGIALMIVLAIGGLDGGTTEFVATCQAYNKFELFIWDWDYAVPMTGVFMIAMLFQNLAFASDQCTVQRVLASPLKDVRKLCGMFVFCAVVIAFVVQFCGISIFSFFHAHPEMMNPTMTNDQVIPLFVVQKLPTGIAGLIIAALFAASMSTLSSSMNSVATIACEDWYRKFKPECTDHQRLIFMKYASLIVGVVGTISALVMAGMNITSMFKTWNLVCALIGGGFIGIYILGMFTKRANSIGVVVGAFTSIGVTLWVKEATPLHWTFYGPVAVISCLIVGYVVSLVTPSQNKDLAGLTIFSMVKAKTDADIGK